MSTALEQRIQLNVKLNKANQQAIMVVHELRDYIPDACKDIAEQHLAQLFLKEDVEITTAEGRKLLASSQR